ncbi:OpgC domain-containing protein [Mesorhizobium sp. RP14(2022)]|uniref:OpgC domain-containing protein n=1 Tax=Mesorhizobium liriopis TaxID=2953882 RepID=A0ABT1BZZ8_9HYPH|nr:OpgC domain-containing protein [Mesorhizobium liriopis]MCO6048176.1 OpgC domain-containing protein [Mesorhizobium liriopis]
MQQHSLQQRETRIDLFRALCLITIFINHVPGNVFEMFTHRNFGFSDSAEAFVLMSGIAAGMVYGPRFEPGRRIASWVRAWKRAGRLYVTHIATTVGSLAIFAGVALYTQRPMLLNQLNIDTLVDNTPAALVGLATMGHQIGYNNILSLYVVLMLLLPLMLFIGKRSIPLMLSLSVAVWLAAGLYQVAPRDFPREGVWFLNPLSWQLLFALGVAGAMLAKRPEGLKLPRWSLWAAGAYLLFALVWVKWPLWGLETKAGLPLVIAGFDKTYESLPRLLHVLAIAALIFSLKPILRFTKVSYDHPLAVMGRHSLPVFVSGTLLAMLAQTVRWVSAPSNMLDAVLVIGGVLLQFGVAYALEAFKKLESAGKPKAPALQPVVGA